MTETDSTDREAVTAFYEGLAPDYDAMTAFGDRFVRERPFIRLLVERFSIRRAADAGSGTGFHALLLAELGVDVTAVDLSAAMVRKLRAHATDRALRLRASVGDIRELPRHLGAPVDAVVCMGNTLAHLVRDDELEEALQAFASSLKSGGVALIQLVNFDRLLADRPTIQSIRQDGGVTFVRFYEYDSRGVRFHLLKIWNEGSTTTHRLQSVRLHPLRQETMKRALKHAGFAEVSTYGGISLEEFQPTTSKDLVLLARRRA